MTRVMYDSTEAAALPTGADLYAGYDDGHWDDGAAITARFPGVRVVRITTDPADAIGDVLDVERGDATPGDVPAWLTRRRAAGAWPSVYVSQAAYATVAGLVARYGLPVPPWWVADYVAVQPILPAAWVAWQWRSTPGYDQSVVADYWPGIDPAPIPPEVAQMAATETILLANGKRSITGLDSAGHLHVFTEGADAKVTGGWSVMDVTDAIAEAYPGQPPVNLASD